MTTASTTKRIEVLGFRISPTQVVAACPLCGKYGAHLYDVGQQKGPVILVPISVQCRNRNRAQDRLIAIRLRKK